MVKIWNLDEIQEMRRRRLGAYFIRYPPPEGRFYKTASWVFEHRLLMESVLNRQLLRTEHVHHKNGNKLDNSISNLEVLTARAHAQHHSPRLGRSVLCPICGEPFYLSRSNAKRGRKTCSNLCAQKLPSRIAAMKRNLRPKVETPQSARITQKILRLRSAGKTWTQVKRIIGPNVDVRDRYHRATRTGRYAPGGKRELPAIER